MGIRKLEVLIYFLNFISNAVEASYPRITLTKQSGDFGVVVEFKYVLIDKQSEGLFL